MFLWEEAEAQNTKLERYLLSHQGGARYLVATLNAITASPIILDTGQPVMALGGFAGSDPILTPGQLVQLVSHGTVRFFLLSAPNTSSSRVTGTNGQLTQWVQQSCHVVPQQLWSSPQNQNSTSPPAFEQQSGSGSDGGLFGQGQLYDCAGAAS